MSRIGALKLVLIAISAYHIVFGAGAFLSRGVAEALAANVFGITLNLDPAMAFVVKVLGIYAILFGLMAGVAARAPERYPALLNLVVVLYALRVLNKLMFKNELVTGLSQPEGRVWIEAALLAGFGLAVLLLKPRPAKVGFAPQA